MPCDSVRSISVDLKALGRIDPNLLHAALVCLGVECTVLVNGNIQGRNVNWMPGQEMNLYGSASRISLDQVKQAYSAEVVKSTAKRFGWQIKEVGKFQYEVVKR